LVTSKTNFTLTIEPSIILEGSFLFKTTMILTANQEDNITVETSGINSIVGGIDESNISIIMEMVSSSFYSNKIGSIIREITSNCFDSHKRANVDNPVVIKVDFDYENDIYYIEFKDVGTGLSPDAIKYIYMRWFTSDKRSSNEEIGGFGIGSKSPFAYTDMFYINTVSEGIRYDYIHYKDERNAKGVREFKLDLLLEEPTNQRNGTSIRIDIQKEDLPKFLSEINEQLSYFDNVFVQKGESVYSHYEYNNKYNIDNFNREKIFEYKTFKYRDRIHGHNHQDSELFILIDTVKYPINFKELDIKVLTIPFGLKFKIGELSVTPNRENIEYTQKNKDLIISRYNEMIEEIAFLIQKQNKFEFDTLKEYRKSISSVYLTLGNEQSNCKLLLDKNVVFNHFGIEVKKVFKPLENFKYNITNTVLDIFYKPVGVIKYDGSVEEHNYMCISNVEEGREVYIINSMSELSKAINYSLSSGTQIYIRKKLNKDDVFNFYRNFGYVYNKKYPYGERRLNDTSKVISTDKFLWCNYYDYNFDDVKVKKIEYVNGKKIKHEFTVRRNLRIGISIDKAVNSFTLFKYFDSLLNKINYSDIVLTQEMIDDYKEFLKDKNKTLKRRKNGKILVYIQGVRKEINILELEKAKFVFYKIRNEKCYFKNNMNELIDVNYSDINQVIYEEHSSVKKSIRSYFNNSIILEISKSNFNQIRHLKNLVTFGEFFNNHFVKSLMIKKAFYKRVYQIDTVYSNENPIYKLCRLSNYYKKIHHEIYINRIDIFSNLEPKLYSFTKEDIQKNSYFNHVLNLIEQVKQWNKDLGILRYVSYNAPLSILREILSYNCKKINKIEYLKYLDSYYVYPNHILLNIIETGNHYKNLKEEKELELQNKNKNLVYL